METPRHESMSLAQFAEVSAHLQHAGGEDAQAVLARLGVDAAWFAAARRTWLSARRAELDAGRGDVTRAFGRAFKLALRRLAEPATGARAPRTKLWSTEVPAGTPPAQAPVVSPAAPSAREVASGVAAAPPVTAFADRRAPAATDSLDTTQALGNAILRDPLPFRADAAASAASAARAPVMPAGAFVAPPARPASPSTPGASASRTLALSTSSLPGAASPPGLPDLTVVQYASLRVELRGVADPGPVLARYGVQPSRHTDLDAHWRLRFELDPLLRMMFAKAFANYLAALRGG